jgi:shikimate kinase
MNIYITGFMGTGKTAAGRKLARLMGRRFIDLDAAIERRAERSVTKIFLRGEATFRRLESAALRRVAAQKNLVVALGGGTLIEPANAELVQRTGTLIYLSCAMAELRRRLNHPKNRPLLDCRKSLARLLAERKKGYDQAAIRISTTSRSTARTASRIAEKLS